MGYIDDLRTYLGEVERSPPAVPEVPEIDVTACRDHLLACFERLEEEKSCSGDEIADRLREWSGGKRLEHFLSSVAKSVLTGIEPGADSDRVLALTKFAIEAGLGLSADPPSLTKPRAMVLTRLAEEALEISKRAEWCERYAFEIRATSHSRGRVTLTAIGRVFLALTGREAVRWLLHIEAVESFGPSDDWHVCKETARYLTTHFVHGTGSVIDFDEDWSHSWSTFRRLVAFGLIEHLHEYQAYVLTDRGRELLTEIASDEETPFGVLAAALLEDDVQASLARAEPALVPAIGQSSTAGLRHARMVAHEVKNALTPVQLAVAKLAEALTPEQAASTSTYRRRIDSGMDRVFAFIEQTLRTADLAREPRVLLTAATLIKEAVSSLDAPIEVESPDAECPSFEAPRQRLTIALVNVLQNALQAVLPPPRVVVSTRPADDGGAVLILIDDDGPGVAAADRETVFRNGVSRRAGGSGYGLAFAREVVETELGGKILCDASPLGGARFTIRLEAAAPAGKERPE